jgi:AcrR family transcriptional regulator
VLRAATHVLLAAPLSSLGDVAAEIGIGRTTLHRLFPTRHDLLMAIAHDALDDLARVYADAGLGADPADAAAAMSAIDDVVARLIPRGASLLFLLRAPELMADVTVAERSRQLDEPLHRTVAAAQRLGALSTEVQARWATEMLLATVFVAWEQIEAGRLAPLDAPGLVMRTWTAGVGR